MEYTSTIVVIGGTGKGENPAKLHTQIEPVRLGKDMSMAITSISHGELYNVHSGNNKIYLNSTYVGMIGAGVPGSSIDYVLNEAGSLMGVFINSRQSFFRIF